jgi:cyanophycin synthetase
MEVSLSAAGACEACGDFPVNHFLTYAGKSFDAWARDRTHALQRSRHITRLSDFLRTTAILSGPQLIRALHMLSGAKTQHNPSLAATTRAAAIWQEALRRGIAMEQLMLFGSPIDSYRARLFNRWIYFENLPIPPVLEAQSFPWADDKLIFKRFLEKHQLPAAPAYVATDLHAARELLRNLHMPAVVKPRLGSNSRHTTPYVQTDIEFEAAFRSAQQLGRYVLVEEYLDGHLCRATVVAGKLAGFLESRQPTITGDGIHTVAELITDKNAHKKTRVSDIAFSRDNEAHISRQGYSLDSVLEKGVTIRVARLPGRLMGGQSREMLAAVHPKLRDYVEKTARLLQVPIVGFDLIIPNPEADPDTQTWGILEANTVPFIEIHSDPLYGEPSNVAAAVWDLWK